MWIFLVSLNGVQAHEGPPYAVFVDKQVGPCMMSVWADPDVGIGTFFIILEPMQGGTLPDDIKVDIFVQPVNNRVPEARYSAVRENLSKRVQYKAEAQFDTQEFWRTRILLQTSKGNGETSIEVEATPPGFGRWDLIIYVFPFALIGVLWLRAFFRGRNRKKAGSQ